jgi:UPF0176 protein
MTIHHIAGYQFIALQNLEALRSSLSKQCGLLQLKGTILLSHEGINISLAGASSQMACFLEFLKQDPRFNTMSFHHSNSQSQVFKKLKIKLKKEIISMHRDEIDATSNRGPSIKPNTLKAWLDEKKDFILLDTRNRYELDFGSFAGAKDLGLSHFSEFPTAIDKLDKQKPIVMFCTGGVRCEKASLYMLNHGFNQVYQLEGGILGYFSEIGSAHYQGECFVFDERISIAPPASQS